MTLRPDVTIVQQTIEGSTLAVENTEGGDKQGVTPLNRLHLTPGFDPSRWISYNFFKFSKVTSERM